MKAMPLNVLSVIIGGFGIKCSFTDSEACVKIKVRTSTTKRTLHGQGRGWEGKGVAPKSIRQHYDHQKVASHAGAPFASAPFAGEPR